MYKFSVEFFPSNMITQMELVYKLCTRIKGRKFDLVKKGYFHCVACKIILPLDYEGINILKTFQFRVNPRGEFYRKDIEKCL